MHIARRNVLSVLLTCCVVGCSNGGSPSATSPHAGEDARSPVRDASDAAIPDYPLPFLPSSLDLSGIDASRVGDVVVDAANCDLDTDQGTWGCVDPSRYVHTFTAYPSGWKESVFVVKSLRLEPGVVLPTKGQWPAAIVALGDMTLLGSIAVTPGALGGGRVDEPYAQGGSSAGGINGGVMGGESAAGSGASSYCGLGGKGAARPGSSVGPPRAPLGTPELSPLIGGAAGGSGVTAGTGSGGGAIQLVSGGAFLLASGAFVTAPGGGGAAGTTAEPFASGGGSGGSILIEAFTVDIQGTLAANGGGGGQGIGDAGEDGRPSDQAARGGAKTIGGSIVGAGGDGSSRENVNGTDGVAAGAVNPGGGGGGGSGRIRINTPTGKASLTKAVVSPGTTSDCASFGMIQ